MKLSQTFLSVAEKINNKIITVSSEKGGVGKTSLTLSAAHGLQKAGKKVLVVDTDPQGDLTALINRLNHITDSDAKSLDIVTTANLYDDQISSTKTHQVNGLHVVIGTNDLYKIDQRPMDNFVLNFEKNIKQIMKENDFDVCIIDTPPTAGNRMISAQVAADLIIIPVELSVLAIKALPKVISRLKVIASNLNRPLPQVFVLPNKIDKRTKTYKQAMPILLGSNYNVASEVPHNEAIKRTVNEAVSIWDLNSTQSSRVGRIALETSLKACLASIV